MYKIEKKILEYMTTQTLVTTRYNSFLTPKHVAASASRTPGALTDVGTHDLATLGLIFYGPEMYTAESRELNPSFENSLPTEP